MSVSADRPTRQPREALAMKGVDEDPLAAGGLADLPGEAEQLFQEGEFKAAFLLFEEIIRRFPEHVETFRVYARAAQQIGAERLACRLLLKATAAKGSDPEILVDLAMAYLRLRSLAKAESTLLQALHVDPSHARARMVLARLRGGQGFFETAREEYKRAMREDPGCTDVARQGMACLNLNQLWREISDDPRSTGVCAVSHSECLGVGEERFLLAHPFLTEPECQVLIAKAGKLPAVDGIIVRVPKRRATVFKIPPADLPVELARKIYGLFALARNEFGITELDEIQGAQLSHYPASNAGCFEWHTDSHKSIEGAGRKLSLVIQLSPERAYEGGELQIRNGQNIWVAPRACGTGIAFPSTLEHRVTPVSQGNRWSLVCWAAGPADNAHSGLALTS